MRIYIASAYTKGDVAKNVKVVIDVADKLLDMGHTPYIPHLNHFWHIVSPKDYDFWYDYDLSFLDYWAEALLRIPNESVGADNEVRRAITYGIPVYYSLEELKEDK